MKTKGYVIILLVIIVFAAVYIFQKTTDITLERIFSGEEVALEEVDLIEDIAIESVEEDAMTPLDSPALADVEDIAAERETSEDFKVVPIEEYKPFERSAPSQNIVPLSPTAEPQTSIFEVEYVDQFVKITERQKERLDHIEHIYFIKTETIAAVMVSACECPTGEGWVTITTTLFGKPYTLSFENMNEAISVATDIIQHISTDALESRDVPRSINDM
jgi:hypothetical protein